MAVLLLCTLCQCLPTLSMARAWSPSCVTSSQFRQHQPTCAPGSVTGNYSQILIDCSMNGTCQCSVNRCHYYCGVCHHSLRLTAAWMLMVLRRDPHCNTLAITQEPPLYSCTLHSDCTQGSSEHTPLLYRHLPCILRWVRVPLVA